MLGAAQLDGQPLPIFEMLSYFLLLVVAGNETTRNATSGGVQALIDNPEQWQMLQSTIPRCCAPRSRRSCAGSARSSSSRAPRREDYTLRGQNH